MPTMYEAVFYAPEIRETRFLHRRLYSNWGGETDNIQVNKQR